MSAEDKSTGIAIRFIKAWEQDAAPMTMTPDEIRRFSMLVDPVGYVINQMNFVLEAPPETDSDAEAAMRQLVAKWRDILSRRRPTI